MSRGGRQIPHDLDAEESLLGAMMLSRAAVAEGLDVVTAGDYYKPANGAVHRAIERLYALGSAVDPVTVVAELDAAGDLAIVGGKPEVLRLASATPASANHAGYARIVRDRAVARRSIGLGAELAEAGYGMELDRLGRLVDDAARLLDPPRAGAEPSALLDLDDLAVLAERDLEAPEKPWIVPGLFRVLEVLILTGGEGWGKATLLRQIGVAVASGIHPFLGINVHAAARQVDPTGQTVGATLRQAPDGPLRVLYVDLQEDRVDMGHELLRLRRRAGDDYAAGHFKAVSRPQGMDLLAARDRRWLEGLLSDHDPDLVLMGPLVRMYRSRGTRSRYDEDLVDEVTDTLDELRVRFRFGLMLEGHAGNDRDGDDAWRVRGSSVWRSWPTFGLGMKPLRAGPPREVELKAWRGARHAGRPWPRSLIGAVRGGWPWRVHNEDYDAMAGALGIGSIGRPAVQDPLQFLDDQAAEATG